MEVGVIWKKNWSIKGFFLLLLLLSIYVGLLCILAGLMYDDVLRVLKQIVLDNELDYFADWGNLAKENFPCTMNDSRFLPGIQNLLRASDDGILDAELKDLYAITLSQSIKAYVWSNHLQCNRLLILLLRNVRVRKQHCHLQKVRLRLRHLFQSIASPIFSQTNLNSKMSLCMNGAAQQSSIDAGNLQQQANANNGIRFDNINIGEEEESLEDDEEIEEFVSCLDERKAKATNRFQNATIATRQYSTQER
jgi:hypothetical protein